MLYFQFFFFLLFSIHFYSGESFHFSNNSQYSYFKDLLMTNHVFCRGTAWPQLTLGIKSAFNPFDSCYLLSFLFLLQEF